MFLTANNAGSYLFKHEGGRIPDGLAGSAMINSNN